MKVLGISAFYHDAAACLVDNGRIMAAAHEERFTRRKHDPSFPEQAIRFCLQHTGIRARDLSAVVFYEKPIIKFDRILETYLSIAPAGFRSFQASFPLWMKEKLNIRKLLAQELCNIEPIPEHWRNILRFSEHHLSHAASAFYPSPFDNAAVITLDGAGEWTTGAIWSGNSNQLQAVEEMRFPHSLGLLYAAFTQYLGFRVNDGEFKVMGLAAYGTPRYESLIHSELLELHDNGSFRLNMDYFDFTKGITMTNKRFHCLFGEKPRQANAPFTRTHQDIAASIQRVTEQILLAIARHARQITGHNQLCMAGGVALNCSANGLLRRERIFDDIWVQPASGDAGGALGAALAWHYMGNRETTRRIIPGKDGMSASLLGPAYSEQEIIQVLEQEGLSYEKVSQSELIESTAQALAKGEIVGWFQNRAEFGPRALGARSILADPCHPAMRDKLNQHIKKRENFRPFAPAILAEKASTWFDQEDSPYMLFTSHTKENITSPDIPAAVHIDGTSRFQSVSAEDHPLFHQLLSRYETLTGVPVLLNTSFNVKDEPIVNTPSDAIRCMRNANLDRLVIGSVTVTNAFS